MTKPTPHQPQPPAEQEREKRWLSKEETMSGIDLIATERERQITEEGWKPDHDDHHTVGELLQAAGAYMARAMRENPEGDHEHFADALEDACGWPWDESMGRADPERDLVRAGALIAAEIDRLRRAR